MWKVVYQNTTVITSTHRDIAVFGEITLLDDVLMKGVFWP